MWEPGHPSDRVAAANLVKLQALSPGQRRHRKQVLDALWPQHNLAGGLNNLHRIQHVARRVFVPELVPGSTPAFLSFQGEVLCLDARGPARVDVDPFTAALTTAADGGELSRYQVAAAIYWGDAARRSL